MVRKSGVCYAIALFNLLIFMKICENADCRHDYSNFDAIRTIMVLG